MKGTSLLLLLLLSAPAQALLETCTATALPVSFGAYDPVSGAAVDGTGQVTVLCTAVVSINVGYSISLSSGGAGSYAPRHMSLLSNTLNYNLYTSAARNTVWGNGSGGTSTVSDSYALALLLVSRDYPVYARVFASQNVAAGAYTDSITVTINY